MTDGGQTGPVLFCYDGSEGSRGAMRSVVDLVERPVDAVVLTVWETVATRLARSGAFITIGGVDLNDEEEAAAAAAAEEGAARAMEHGYKATPMVKQATEGITHAILEVAEELSVRLIVCGQRGRGPVRTALLGSVSHSLASHTHRPVLIAPEQQA
jgi:nucleotide-binding universal stress UspA family protein